MSHDHRLATVVRLAKVNWSAPAPIMGEIGAELRKIYFLKSAAGRGYGQTWLKVKLEWM